MTSTTERCLSGLRLLMKDLQVVPKALEAYIIPSDDSHQSEYVADCDKRRHFISGFTGSAGTAVVTGASALLWTDGRYFTQAARQLSPEWMLMKIGVADTPKMHEWLVKHLPPTSCVGVDATLMPATRFKDLSRALRIHGHQLVAVSNNLVDLIWHDRPSRSANPLQVHELRFAGVTWPDKLRKLRQRLTQQNCIGCVVTALDDVAWLFNVRGQDVPCNPVAFAYAIVHKNYAKLFIAGSKITDAVRHHLSSQETDVSVEIVEYEQFFTELRKVGAELASSGGKFWLSDLSSQAVLEALSKQCVLVGPSIVAEMKTIKNEAEIEGMRQAHVRDAVAVCEYLLWLEQQLSAGRSVSEVEGALKVDQLRAQQAFAMGVSFETISASGPNGAIIHYRATADTDRPINTAEMYLLDSGGQYLDGTTDVTRTVHFGQPTQHERECFTRVLIGHIQLSKLVFPERTTGNQIDAFARQALWQVGLDYRHGTGHGVGAYLNVHEGPGYIGTRAGADPNPFGLRANMILTDEPGYYKEGQFGIRIENAVLVKEAAVGNGFLTFEPLTLLPIQRSLIEQQLLTTDEQRWVNEYHNTVRRVVGAEMERQGKADMLRWLLAQTDAL